MIEKQKYRDAFEAYYNLGANRSLQKLCHDWTKIIPNWAKKSPSLNTLKNWSKAFNWQEKIQIRDMEIARGIEKKIINANIDMRAEGLKEVCNIKTMVWEVLHTAFTKDKKGKQQPIIKVKNSHDLKGLTDSLLKAEEMKLKLSGEPDQKIEHRGELKVEHSVKIEDTIKKYKGVIDDLEQSD